MNSNHIRDFLDGVRVLEIGTSNTVHLTGMFLADNGAEVIRVEEKDSFYENSIFDITDRLKESIYINPEISEDRIKLKDLIKRADILIEDRSSKMADFLEELETQSVIRCNVKPFNANIVDPYWREESIGVLSGLYETPAGIGKPHYFDLPIISTLGALYAANAVTLALVGKKRQGTIFNYSISLQDVGLFTQLFVVMMRTKVPTAWKPLQMLASPFMGTWRTADNKFIYVHFGAPAHLRSFLFLLDKLGLQEDKKEIKAALAKSSKRDPVVLSSAREAFKITNLLKNLFLKKSADEWEDSIGGAGLCCTKVRSLSEWINHPQVRQSDEIRDYIDDHGNTIKIPGDLFEFSEKNKNSIEKKVKNLPVEILFERWDIQKEYYQSSSSEYPLHGLKVLDLSRIIAGPYCGRIMSEFGAQVLHLYIRPNHLRFEEPFHIALNGGKESLVLDYSTVDGKEAFSKLIDSFDPDVIVHNFLDDAAVKLGIDYESLNKRNKKIICVDIKSYNPKGPWSNRPGVEWNIQSTSGIVHAHSAGTVPDTLAVPFNDICTGLMASFGMALALYKKGKTGDGNRVSAYLSTSSILLQMDRLNTELVEKDRLVSYYKASDTWFLLSAKYSDLATLKEIEEFSKFELSDFLNTKKMNNVFKRRRFDFWSRSIQELGKPGKIFIYRQKHMKTLLKEELQRGGESIFSYKEHESFGTILCARSPLIMKPLGLINLSPARYFGSNNPNWLRKEWFKNRKFEIVIPSATKETFVKRTFWIVSQFKWLVVAIYKKITLGKQV